jgi:ribose transport system substrate-binding protein
MGQRERDMRWAGMMVRRLMKRGALPLLIAGGVAASGTTAASDATAASSSSTLLSKAKATVAEISKPITTIPQTVPLPRTPPKGDTIVYMYGGGVASQVALANEVKLAATAIGWHYYGISFDQSNPSTLMSGLQTALAKHPTVVASAAQPYSIFTSSIIAEYKAAKVPLIFAGQSTPLPASTYLIGNPLGPAAYGPVGTDLAAWFIDNSGGKGKVLYITVPQLPLFNSLNSSFNREVSQLCSQCERTDVPMTIAQASDPSEETSIIISALQRHPGYKYIFFPDGGFTPGTITSSLKSVGLGSVKVFGQDYLPPQGTALQTGTEAAWLGESLNVVSCEITDLALRYVEHAPGSANDDLLPERLMTQSNIKKELTFNEPSNVLAIYEKLWKVPASH